jgi:NAD(P)H-dependent flavin oxidoreductase YrpB (nitropropane dioxygenase family)
MRGLTERPFAVNLVLEWPQHERLVAALEEGARIVSFHWGNPEPYVGLVHEGGGVVLATAGSSAEAKELVEVGVDVVVAQGWEAGGHVWGDVSTLALVPVVVDAVAPAPVVAAGGIADGRGLAAVLTLGAQAAWMGTRFVASAEAALHPSYKERLVAAAETDTLHSTLFDVGWPDAPVRTLRNSTVRVWEDAGHPLPGARPGEREVVAVDASGREIVRYSSADPTPGMTGELEALALYAGQGVGLVQDVRPAAEIVRQTAEEAEAILSRLGG